MKTYDTTAIIAIRNERSEIESLDELHGNPEMNTSGHPFGSVLLRLKLAIALICASRQPQPIKARVIVRG